MKSRKLIALLRGINVGGKNKIKMADLRTALEGEGFEVVSTYIQSGNICFASGESNSALAKLVSRVIEQQFGCDVPVFVREQSWFESLIKKNPFCADGQPKFDLKELHATMLAKKPSTKAVESLGELEFEDDYEIVEDVVYLRLTCGYSKTKLTNGFLEKKLGVAATSRNWKTICKLTEM